MFSTKRKMLQSTQPGNKQDRLEKYNEIQLRNPLLNHCQIEADKKNSHDISVKPVKWNLFHNCSFIWSCLAHMFRHRSKNRMQESSRIIKKIRYCFVVILLFADKSVTPHSVIKSGFSLTPRIHGGRQADPGQFVYQVSLRKVWPMPKKIFQSLHYCGGTLISDRYEQVNCILFADFLTYLGHAILM